MSASRVLFISSNGGGLGHLTRLLAIARQLPEGWEPWFMTMSTGVQAVAHFGFPVDYMPGPTAGPLRGSDWLAYLKDRVRLALRTIEPAAVVFDGTYVYRGLIDALAECAPHVLKVWSRRAMWRPIDDRRAEQALHQAGAFDLILEPGEHASAVDDGFTAKNREGVVTVAPIVLLNPDELTERAEARAELGIDPKATAVLLNLGAGNINEIAGLMDAVGDVLRERADVHLVAMQSIIASGSLPDRPGQISTIEAYPLARLIRAFDLCVAAPGYNSFHELLAYGVPTLFIPNEHTELDDQLRRARWGEEHGACLMRRATDLPGLGRALHELLEPSVREQLTSRCLALPASDGASAAARLISERARAKAEAPPSPPKSAPVEPVPLSKRLYRAGRGVKRAVTRAARLLTSRPARPQPPADRRLVVLAADAAVDPTALAQSDSGAEVVVVCPPAALKSLYRAGLTVEVAPRELEHLAAPGVRATTYGPAKLELITRAYNCRTIEHLPAPRPAPG